MADESTSLSPGEALRKLRESRGLSLRQASKLTEGTISHGHIRELEVNPYASSKITLTTLQGLARAYDVTTEHLTQIVLGTVSKPQNQVTVTRIPSSLRTLPSYRLTVPRNGKGELVRIEDGLLPLEEGLEGDFELYQLEEEGLEPTTYLIRKQTYARTGHIAICDVPEKGTLAAKVKSVQGKLYVLETSFETFAAEKVTIRGVAVYRYERLEEPPNGVN